MSLIIEPVRAIEIFYSYAHEDERLRKKLEKQLSLLKQQSQITEWYDRKISAGKEWADEIDSHLNTAQIILLLVSPDYLASDYCYGIEMKRAIERHKLREARVIPIILRPTYWQGAPFGKLQPLPTDGKPATRWRNLDEAFLDIERGIRKAIKELSANPETTTLIPIPNVSSSLIFSTNMSSAPQEESPEEVHILAVDDAENIIEFLRLGLRYEGYTLHGFGNGLDALAYLKHHKADLVILDVGLPGMNGLEVCRQLRSNPITQDVPILMLTAKDEVRDRITGLDRGADDYLTKPFLFDEVLAHIRALLRRSNREKSKSRGEVDDDEIEDQVLDLGDLHLNRKTHEVIRGGRLIELTPTEYNLLHLFMSHPRQVLDRQTILNRVWGYDFLGETNIIEVYVRYLREKLEDSPSKPRIIQTIRGVGYMLTD